MDFFLKKSRTRFFVVVFFGPETSFEPHTASAHKRLFAAVAGKFFDDRIIVFSRFFERSLWTLWSLSSLCFALVREKKVSQNNNNDDTTN